jgi:hypothetical protein
MTTGSTPQLRKSIFGGVRAGSLAATVLYALCALGLAPKEAQADENGVSFWLPGIYGSLAAVPQQQPGWAFATFNYFDSVSGGGNIALGRELSVGDLPVSFSGTANLNVHATIDIQAFVPSYAFATPFLGGQASLGLMSIVGGNTTSINGTLNGTLTGPGGGVLPIMRTDSFSDSVTGFGDLYPQFTVRWNAGVNNYMTYLTGDIPVGTYSSSNLANIGIGHGAIDGGVGYTYFDQKTGHEFSAVTGLTGNFENMSTGYTSGLDWHLDWGASQFLTKQWQIGLVGYFYDQLTPDSGCAPALCPFESRVIGVGPQIGYIFPVGNMQGYLNLKGYGEFDNANRPDGYNIWLTFVLSPAAPTASASSRPMVTKAMPPD